MKRIVYREIGNPADVLNIEEIAPRALEAGEARVAVLATPIHPSNVLKISGQYGIKPIFPAIPGSEGVGKIMEVAPGVTQVKPGQLVLLLGYSTWQQELIGPAGSFIPLPDGADVQQLSMLAINPLTALCLLEQFVSLQAGDYLVQNAANSAVGCYLIQLAKQRGIRTINVVRRESAVQGLLDIGADHVLIDGPELTAQIEQAAEAKPISLAIDAVGGESFTKLTNALSFRGTIVCYGLMSMTEPVLPSGSVIFKELQVRGFWLTKWFEHATQQEKHHSLGKLIQLVSSGQLEATVGRTFSLEEIKEAVTLAAQEGRDGKVLLLPNPI